MGSGSGQKRQWQLSVATAVVAAGQTGAALRQGNARVKTQARTRACEKRHQNRACAKRETGESTTQHCRCAHGSAALRAEGGEPGARRCYQARQETRSQRPFPPPPGMVATAMRPHGGRSSGQWCEVESLLLLCDFTQRGATHRGILPSGAPLPECLPYLSLQILHRLPTTRRGSARPPWRRVRW